MISEPLEVTLLVCDAFQRMGVPYLIGGSFASIIHGEIRTTLDSDLVADLHKTQVADFIKYLGVDFYADEGMILEAIERQACFNLIHRPTLFKVDVFILKQRDFDQEQMKRRKTFVVASDPERTAFFATAEDTILAKLEWFKKGHEVSERQWRDVIGIFKLQKNNLDMAYLQRWAKKLSVDALLEQAMKEL